MESRSRSMLRRFADTGGRVDVTFGGPVATSSISPPRAVFNPITGGDITPLFTRPLSATLMVVAVLLLFWPMWREHRRRTRIVRAVT